MASESINAVVERTAEQLERLQRRYAWAASRLHGRGWILANFLAERERQTITDLRAWLDEHHPAGDVYVRLAGGFPFRVDADASADAIDEPGLLACAEAIDRQLSALPDRLRTFLAGVEAGEAIDGLESLIRARMQALAGAETELRGLGAAPPPARATPGAGSS